MFSKKKEEFQSFKSKKTTQGNGQHSRPKKGHKKYRGQGR